MATLTDTPTQLPRFADMDEVHPHTAIALEREGLQTAFPIQASVIPVATEGHDVLVKSPTGSGKTLAFGLPIIARIPRGERTPTAVILVPGRELAIQVRDELVPIAWSLQQRCVAVYGGGHGHKQAKAAASAPIIVATPGRLVDLIRARKLNLSQATMLVLDEADRMLDMGFTPQVEEVVRAMPRRMQTMLFSATLEGRVSDVARRLTTDPVCIERTDAPGAGEDIAHVLVSTAARHKVDTLVDQLEQTSAARDLTVVFVRTQKGADNLTQTLQQAGIDATTIHGGLPQPERLAQYRRFQSGECDVLVATDVFARGMDLDRITHVVNFELPEDADAYRHRTGRTGRAGRAGTALTLVTPKQRPIVQALLEDLGLPARELLASMRPGSTTRIVPAPSESLTLADDDAAAAPSHSAGQQPTRTPGVDPLDVRGNGRGKPRRASSKIDVPTGRRRGTITTYDPRRGFGFIKQAGGGKDVFFHRRAISGPVEDRGLRPGVPVEFALELGTGNKLRAIAITIATRASSGSPRLKTSKRRR